MKCGNNRTDKDEKGKKGTQLAREGQGRVDNERESKNRIIKN